MKLFRLAWFNLKKHLAESLSVFLLLLLCMTLLSSAISSISGIEAIVDTAYENTQCVHNYVNFLVKDFKQSYADFIAGDERITECFEVDTVYSGLPKYINKQGKEITQGLLFLTMDQDAKFEKLILDSPYTPEEILTKEHFILLPYYAKDTLKFRVGDTFEMVYNKKSYPFEVAGFYESGFLCDGLGLKCIVSSRDYALTEKLFFDDRTLFIGFETATPEDARAVLNDLQQFAEENALGGEAMGVQGETYADVKADSTQILKTLMYLMIAMSVVVFLAIIFMIRFRIQNDIDEQMVAIGVLEALGYRSGEISLSYMIEYLLIAVPAVLGGLLLSLAASPMLLHVGEIMTGHHGAQVTLTAAPIVMGLILLVFVAAISFFRALRIRKLPPVVAFRKGTGNHSHRKDILPLEKTKMNVHLRLAAKGFLSELRTELGMGACISVAVIALMVCFILYDFMCSGVQILAPLAGVDISEVSVVALADTDAEALRDEIEAMPEVKEVRLTSKFGYCIMKIDDPALDFYGGMECARIYASYDTVQNIRPSEGRCPKHDNEVMLRSTVAKMMHKSIGDTVTMRIGKMQADYVICGLSSSIFTVGDSCWMTEAGYRRIDPQYRSVQLDIFLENGVDAKAFEADLFARYGTAEADADASGTLEERIRAEAGTKMTKLMEMYGINHMDYAIQVGDQVITGNSSRFQIRSATSIMEALEQALENILKAFRTGTGIFMVISLFTITLIIFLVVHAAIKKQRSELGIQMGMGYTARELMLQTAVRIVPTLIVSVIFGSVAGIGLARVIYQNVGPLPFVAGKVILLAVLIVLFGFAVAWLSAGRIRKISVYELMQE